jgi:hypothetical protein
VAAEERPALTASARAGLRQYAVGAGESLRRGQTKERGQEERKKKGVGGLDMAGAHISRFSMVMRRIRARNSGAIGRRPVLLCGANLGANTPATPGGPSTARYWVSQ